MSNRNRSVTTAVLAPGALMLGNHRQCFVCGHEHSMGDRCVSFHFTPEFMEGIVASVPDARRLAFTMPSLPPLSGLLPLAAAAEAARDVGDDTEFEEVALRLAGAVSTVLAETKKCGRAPTKRDERRIASAVRRIETQAHESLALADLACTVAMSPYHFLRTFRAVIGM